MNQDTAREREPTQRLRDLPWEGLSGLAEAVLPALSAILAGQPADKTLSALLRKNKDWTAPQRTAVAEALFGVGLWRRRLAYQAGLSSWEGADPRLLLFALLRDLAGVPSERAARLVGLGPKVPLPAPKPPPASYATRHSLPDWLAEVFQRELGDEADAFATVINAPGPIFLRANLLKTSRDALSRALLREGVPTRPTRYAPFGLCIEGARANIYGLYAWQRGECEVQDEGSQLLAALVEASPGETIFDVCAGAGGKTLALAAALENRGALYAYDPDEEKLSRLRLRAARAGVTCLTVYTRPPSALQADAVLVDAPCSELGTLRRGPDLRFRLDPAALARFPALQREILEEACRYVRPGGRLIYATCTLHRKENQEVALALEEAHPELRRVRPGAGWLPEHFIREGFFLALPHRHGTDGFFAAVWRREAL